MECSKCLGFRNNFRSKCKLQTSYFFLQLFWCNKFSVEVGATNGFSMLFLNKPKLEFQYFV